MLGSAVEDVSSWVWLGAGIVAVVTGIYGAARWIKLQLAEQDARAKAQFRDAVTETVGPLLEPIREDLGHVHECVERIGKDAVANAQAAVAAAVDAKDAAAAAAVAAEGAKTAASEARLAVAAHAVSMEDHIAADAESFAEQHDWQQHADVALRNIQQAQHPPDRP